MASISLSIFLSFIYVQDIRIFSSIYFHMFNAARDIIHDVIIHYNNFYTTYSTYFIHIKTILHYVCTI